MIQIVSILLGGAVVLLALWVHHRLAVRRMRRRFEVTTRENLEVLQAMIEQARARVETMKRANSRATECRSCNLYWAPWIFGPVEGSPCHHCGSPVTPLEPSSTATFEERH